MVYCRSEWQLVMVGQGLLFAFICVFPCWVGRSKLFCKWIFFSLIMNVQPPTPPRQRQRQHPRGPQPGEGRSYDPAQVGISMYDSLKIFELGYAASYSEVKSQFRALARIYHPINMTLNEPACRIQMQKSSSN